MPPSLRRSRAISRAGLILFGTFLGFFLSEIGLRLFAYFGDVDMRIYLTQLGESHRQPSGLLVPHPTRRLALRPSFQGLAITSDFHVLYRTNSAGFRDREWSVTKKPNVRRVLALGDSFTFGEGVEDTARFTNVLEKRLSGIEILTLGVPGYGVDQVFVQLNEEIARWQPDEVWLFLNGVMVPREHVAIWRDGKPFVPRCRDCSNSYSPAVPSFFDRAWQGPRSYAFALLAHHLTVPFMKARWAKQDEQVWAEIVRGGETQKGAAPKREIAAVVEGPRAEERTVILLRAMKELAAEHHARLTVFNIDSWRDLAFVRSVEGLRYLDFSSQLVQAARERSLIFRHDRHYNPWTHAFLADTIAARLQK